MLYFDIITTPVPIHISMGLNFEIINKKIRKFMIFFANNNCKTIEYIYLKFAKR